MKHFIIVKFDNSVKVQELTGRIKDLFNKSLSIDGVDKVEVYVSNSDLPNRHDLMIEMVLTSPALEAFDSSAIHETWKREYGEHIVSKTIFDCD